MGFEMSEKLKEMFTGPPLFWREYHITWVAVRTRFIDDTVKNFAKKNKKAGFQVVILGVGLDTRPFRLECLRSARACFEVDLPDVIRCKQRALLTAKALCPLISLSVDLDAAKGGLMNALVSVGFDTADVPTLWIMEGLTMYLTPKTNASLYSEMAEMSASGSGMLCGFTPDSTNIPNFPFTLDTDSYRTLVMSSGWKSPQINIFGDDVLNYGRFPAGRALEYSQAFCYAVK